MRALMALAFILAFTVPAQAARVATVEGDKVDMRDGPNETAQPVETLDHGLQIAASNVPIQGFYKVRGPDGKIGFVAEDQLSFAASAPGSGTNGKPKDAPSGKDADAELDDDLLSAKSTEKSEYLEPRLPGQFQPVITVRGMGGLALFDAADLNSLLQTNNFKNGYYFGGEILFTLARKLSLVGRVEKIAKSFSGIETGTKTLFEFDLASQPLQLGLEYRFDPSPKVFWSFSALGGLALNTSLSAIYLVDGTNTLLTEHAWTALAKTTLGLKLFSGRLTVFAEAGYRLLKTSALTPTIKGTDSQIFTEPKAGTYVPVQIDMGGLMGGLGIGLAF